MLLYIREQYDKLVSNTVILEVFEGNDQNSPTPRSNITYVKIMRSLVLVLRCEYSRCNQTCEKKSVQKRGTLDDLVSVKFSDTYADQTHCHDTEKL